MPDTYAGSALYLTWIHPSGTAVLSGDFRTFSVTPSVDYYEQSAGADPDKTYLPGIRDRTLAVSYVDQTGGTVTLDALREGVRGTLVVSPEGTATGSRRETYPAISGGASRNQPYNNIVEISITFQGNGTVTYNNH